jgi:hypothetical protein
MIDSDILICKNLKSRYYQQAENKAIVSVKLRLRCVKISKIYKIEDCLKLLKICEKVKKVS